MNTISSIIFGLSAVCVLGNGQDLCELAKQPNEWNNREITLANVKMLIQGHDIALTPGSASNDSWYQGKCAIFPILPGLPDFLEKGLAVRGESAKPVRQTMEAYMRARRANGGQTWCFTVKGSFRTVRDFQEDSRHRGNGFGYQGHLQSAIIVRDLVRSSCGGSPPDSNPLVRK